MKKLEKPINDVKVTATKRNMKKWVVIGLVVIVAFVGYRYINSRKQLGVKREAFETQRQVMLEYWEEQGLSDEEIKLKLADLRQERVDSGERSLGEGRQDIMHMIGGGRSSRK